MVVHYCDKYEFQRQKCQQNNIKLKKQKENPTSHSLLHNSIKNTEAGRAVLTNDPMILGSALINLRRLRSSFHFFLSFLIFPI